MESAFNLLEGDDLAQADKLQPKVRNQVIYNQLYALYRQLHDAFGGVTEVRRPFRRDEGTHTHQRRADTLAALGQNS
jgi:hypothetical protein